MTLLEIIWSYWGVCVCVSCSVMYDSLWPYVLYPASLLCLWNSQGNNTGVGWHTLLQGIFPTWSSNPNCMSPALSSRFFTTSGTWEREVKVKVTQSCPTLCDPMDYTVTEFSRPEYWSGVAFPFPRGSSQLRDRTQVSHTAGRFFTSWATREAQECWSG